MTISLHEASVLSYLQTLDALAGVLDKGLAHCRDAGIDPESVVESSIHPEMRPFRFQVQSVVLHSRGAMDAVMSGVLELPGQRPAHDYAGLQALVGDARAALAALTPNQVNARAGAEILFNVPNRPRYFTAEGFVLSFSLPNFHFHATTTYAILRGKGVPIGKLDFMGALRLKS